MKIENKIGNKKNVINSYYQKKEDLLTRINKLAKKSKKSTNFEKDLPNLSTPFFSNPHYSKNNFKKPSQDMIVAIRKKIYEVLSYSKIQNISYKKKKKKVLFIKKKEDLFTRINRLAKKSKKSINFEKDLPNLSTPFFSNPHYSKNNFKKPSQDMIVAIRKKIYEVLSYSKIQNISYKKKKKKVLFIKKKEDLFTRINRLAKKSKKYKF